MISHADILWILSLGMEYNLMDKAESLSEIADVIHYRLAMKYSKSREWRMMHPLVFTDVVTEQCFCQSYFDDDNVLQDCTCGKCIF